MKSISRQTLCTLLAAILLTFTACSTPDETTTNPTNPSDNTATTPTEQETEALETEPELPELPKTNMDGWNMRFLNYDDSFLSWAIHPLAAEEVTGDAMNDEIYERNNRLSETYNCTITDNRISRPEQQIAALVQSGDVGAEIVMLYDETVVTQYISGYLQTWDVLPYVDFTLPHWNLSSTETFSVKGKAYAATGDFSLAQSTRSFVLMFNKDMYTNFGLTKDLYQLTMDGKWTIDELLEAENVAILDLNGDGVMDGNDSYGTSGAVKLYFGSLVTGAGIKYIDIDSEGNPYFAIPGNEFALSVMSDILERHAGTNIFYQVAEDIHGGSNEVRPLFYNNQVLFCGTSMKAIVNYRDMESDIGILPFPKYSEEQENYYALTSGGTMATIPMTISPDSYENTGLLLEAMSRDSHEGLVPLYKETLLKSRYARDEGSAAMLDIIFESATYDIGLSVFCGNTYYAYMEIFKSGTNTFSSRTKALTKVVEKDLEKLMQEGEEVAP